MRNDIVSMRLKPGAAPIEPSNRRVARRPRIGAAMLHDDRLFPTDAATRTIARRLYAAVRDLPIISPHGHTDPRWYAENQAFPKPAELFVTPDH